MTRPARSASGFGWRLRRARERAALSQERLSELAGLSRPWVARIESGRAEPIVTHVLALFDVLTAELPDVSLEWLLTGRDAGDAATVGGEVKRRHFARLLAAGVFLGPQTVALALEAEHSYAAERVGPDQIDAWATLTEALARLRPVQPPAELLPILEAHLYTIHRRVRERSATGTHWRRLLSVTGGTAALAGWVAFTAERRRDAQHHLDLAETIAREADDRDVLALTLMLRSHLLSAIHTGGEHVLPTATRLRLHEALTMTSAATPLALRGPVLLRLAEECAHAGMEVESLRYLDEAAALAAGAELRHHPLRPQWGRSRDVERVLVAVRGNCLQMLGRTEEAIALLSRTDSAFPGDRTAMLTDLAAAYARQGDLDRACELLTNAADLSSQHVVPLVARRIVGVRRRHLARWEHEPAVAALDERLSLIL